MCIWLNVFTQTYPALVLDCGYRAFELSAVPLGRRGGIYARSRWSVQWTLT